MRGRGCVGAAHGMFHTRLPLLCRDQAGGHFYVCGDAGAMAADVEVALRDLVQAGLGKDRAAAEAYVAELGRQGRYQRDVWVS